MNKLAVSIAVALALGLTACDDSLKDIKEEIGDNTVKPASRVVFDPGAATPRLSVPNDLLFQGTTDGTLTTDSGAEPDYSNPQVALGALDGWSTQNPFTVAIDFPSGVDLDADSAALPGAVRVFEIVSAGPTSADPDCRPLTQGHACKIVDELVFGVDFVSGAKSNNVAVIPLKPLKPATTYMLVLTSAIKDSTGSALAPSTSYELVKQDDESLPLSSASQLSLQKLINSFEDAAESEGVDRETIVYTASITTQSTDIVLNTVKQLIASSAATRPLMVAPLGYNVGQALVSAGLIEPEDAVFSNPAYAAATMAQVYGGTVSLPYFSAVPTDDNKLAPLTGRWLAKYDSPVTLLGAIQAGLLNPADLGLSPADLQNPANLLGFDVPELDDARHLTKFNPIPNETELDIVPVLMTVPDLAQINLLRAAQNRAPIDMPVGGWPVVIFQHGITGEKENAL
ncbi:MAG: lipase, partial [Gammaproteobacteria bacterium]|nr:lipase [Gammaproteobacteria bacterium]